MSQLSNAVSLHPYFKVQPGKMAAFEEAMNEFVTRTSTEATCLYYDFTVCDDVVFCREAYIGAEGVLHHLENVGSCIETVLTFSDLFRLEVHGPKDDIEKLREPLAELNPDFFTHHTGVLK